MSDSFQAVIDEAVSSSSTLSMMQTEKSSSEKPPPYNSVAPSSGPIDIKPMHITNDQNDPNLRWCSRCKLTGPTYTKSRFQLRHILLCILVPGFGWAICMAQCCAGDMVYCAHCNHRYSDFYGKEGCCDCCPCDCCKNCCC